MRIAVYSDLHLEHRDWRPPDNLSADLVILAGDIAEGAAGVAWAERQFRIPVLYVPGNHEFHGCCRRDLRLAGKSHVRVLDRDAVLIGGKLRVIGCTLWSDYRLLEGQGLDACAAMAQAGPVFGDYRRILTEDGRLATPADTVLWHEQDRRWLAAELAKPFAGPTIVVTHHAPSPRSANPHHPAAPLGPFFASDQEGLIRRSCPGSLGPRPHPSQRPLPPGRHPHRRQSAPRSGIHRRFHPGAAACGRRIAVSGMAFAAFCACPA